MNVSQTTHFWTQRKMCISVCIDDTIQAKPTLLMKLTINLAFGEKS